MDSVAGDALSSGRLRSSRNRQPSLPEQVRAIREKEQRKNKKQKGGNKEEEKPDDVPHACLLSEESLDAVKRIVDEGILKVLTQVNQRMEGIEKRVNILEGEIFEKDREVKRMGVKLTEQEKTIEALREQLESIDTNRRMNTLILKCKEFGGRRMNEDIEADTVRILNKRFPDLQVRATDFQTVHRLQSEHTVICKFVKTKLRNELFDRRLSLRNAHGADHHAAPLFVNESLSPKKQEVFNALLEEKRQKHIYTVFSKRGAVYFKETPESRGRRVDDINHLRSVLGRSAPARASSSRRPAGGAVTYLGPGAAPAGHGSGLPSPTPVADTPAAGPGAVTRDPALEGRRAPRDGSSRRLSGGGQEGAPPAAETGQYAGGPAAAGLGCPGAGPDAGSAVGTLRPAGGAGAALAPPGDRSPADSSVTAGQLDPDDPPAGDPPERSAALPHIVISDAVSKE